MEKLITIILLMFLLSGCFNSAPPRVRTEVQEQYVPLLYCPAPDWKEAQRPVLPIELLTIEQQQNPGEIAKSYKATVKVLQGYAEILERALKEYDNTNKAYEELRKRFKDEWKTEFGDAKRAVEKVN